MANQVTNSTMVTRFTLTTITFFLIFLTSLCVFTFFTFPNPTNTANKPPSSKLHYHNTFLSISSNDTVSKYHRQLTLHPHLAGTRGSHQVTNFVKTQFESFGLLTKVAEYDVLLSYPTRVSLKFGNRELSVPDDTRVVMPYHAYSPNGHVIAPAVYVNYGREVDYVAVTELGVNVSGCIVVVKRGEGLSRADLVQVAAEKGGVAVVMYTPTEYSKGVERGTVMRGVGDPLTPGWGSGSGGGGGGGERLGRDDEEVVKRFPIIPSMPVSVDAAEVILKSLEGPLVPLSWRIDGENVKVDRVGPAPTMLNFSYQGVEKTATISDVFGVIKGEEEPDRYVLLGNHRDAWTYGGVDPNSGTAALLDVARRYGHLMGLGWRPRRTIILCSWDAEEFGMVGSTEWVEANIMNLGKAVAYLNVDCAVQGPGLFPSATPQLDDLIIYITKKVKDPDAEGTTIYEEWTTRNNGVNIQRLSGVDSDFAPFLQHAGIPSLDLYFGKDFPVYHTAFDSYDWMITYGDPLFHRHAAMAGLWGLLALRLADDPILPFNYSSYAVHLQEVTDRFSRMLEGRVSVAPITNSIQHFLMAANEAEDEAKKLRMEKSVSNLGLLKERILNDRLMLAERALLDGDGLLGNKWFKHLVYGPSNKHDMELSLFPSIANAVSQNKTTKHEAAVEHEIWRVARGIQRAADALRGDFF